MLKNYITQATKENILTLNIRVSNIQYSRKLDFDKTTLVNTFLPLLQNTITKPHISHIYTKVAQKQGNNQIPVKQRKNGNSPYTNFNEFS